MSQGPSPGGARCGGRGQCGAASIWCLSRGTCLEAQSSWKGYFCFTKQWHAPTLPCHAGERVAPSLLFFGCRRAAADFYFAAQWPALEAHSVP